MKKDLLYLKRLFSKPFRAVKAGGQTNRNYIVSYQGKGKKFFVRLPWERADMIDRAKEGKNIVALTRNKKLARILPRYYAYILKKKNILAKKSRDVFDVPDGTMVAEYIEGREFTFRMFQQKKYQEALAKVLHIFHTSGVRFANRYDVFRDEIEKYRVAAQKLPLSKVIDQKTVLKFQEIEKEAKGKLRPLKRGLATHNDFIFQNFLVGRNKNIYLLDFEYAGWSMRGGIYYDLGFLFADNLFRDPSTTRELYEDFLGVVDTVYQRRLDRGQIYAGALAVVIMQFWWGLLRYFSVHTQKEKTYFAKYVRDRAKGVESVHSLLNE